MRHKGTAKSMTGRSPSTMGIRFWMGVLLAFGCAIGGIGPVRAGTGNAPGSWVAISLPQLPGQVVHPSGVAVDRGGNLYVSESGDGNYRVQERSASGTWSVIATKGTDPGQVYDPVGVAVDGAGDLYVADSGNDRVQERFGSGLPMASPSLPGDVNGDGKLNIIDATMALQIVVGLAKTTAQQLQAGDLNGDGTIDIRDVTLILKRIVGI